MKTPSPAPTFLPLPLVLCERLVEAPWPYLVWHVLEVSSLFSSCSWDILGVASGVTRTHNPTAKSLIHGLFEYSLSLFCTVPWAFGEEVFYGCIRQDCAPQLRILTGMVFGSGLCRSYDEGWGLRLWRSTLEEDRGSLSINRSYYDLILPKERWRINSIVKLITLLQASERPDNLYVEFRLQHRERT